MADDSSDVGTESILRVADVIGGLMEFWGFKRNMGRMWSVLYLSPTPLSAADLAQRLSLSAGSVSMTLSELARWGVVKKSWQPGERRDYYEPETSFWKMVSRVFREREALQIQLAIESFEQAREVFEQALSSADRAGKKRLQFLVERIDALLSLAKIGQTILNAILAGQSVDALPIKDFSKS